MAVWLLRTPSFAPVALGVLFYRSRYIPRALSVAYAGGAGLVVLGTLLICVVPELIPVVSPAFLVPDALAAWSVCGWLIVKGVKVPQES